MLTIWPRPKPREHDDPASNLADPGQTSLEEPSVPCLFYFIKHAVLEPAPVVFLFKQPRPRRQPHRDWDVVYETPGVREEELTHLLYTRKQGLCRLLVEETVALFQDGLDRPTLMPQSVVRGQSTRARVKPEAEIEESDAVDELVVDAVGLAARDRPAV
jgi:hypothetical protein